ncbi:MULTISPECIES: CBS domain-containing protein [Sphingomonadales]|uniref:CBS domain-containing protein n=2 Tax=Edaphosphingomonas TaxID=3423724 RepID=A0A2T4HQA6_9SPHN|nr:MULTISPECIES: CBS domain-containing protein [Sphingomonas]AGH49459.1 putative signal transduction protein with CBS domains [Sphingomonas sp. MM-1]OHT22050.1 inosine 5'-monophosphate dehydrogenase [Sphingomonas haloaromaticamans]PTD17981.1 CBS domain-containing protein [Sphingomonas fennica]
MTIATILGGKGHDVISVSTGTRVAEVVSLIASKRIGAVPVMDGASVAGILSERDIIYKLQSDGAAILDWPVERVMTAPAITVTGDVPVLHALSLMTKRRIRHLPVVEDGRLAGLVSIGDLVKARIDRIEAEATAMRDYIQGV